MTGRKDRWSKVDPNGGLEDVVLLLLEWLAEQGVDALIRVDAERLAKGRPAWTFAASGGLLEHGLRADGASAEECVSRALIGLRAAGIDVPI